jgi:hypothetical protein
MTQLTLVRDDGAKLYIDIDGRAGAAYLNSWYPDGRRGREVKTFGPGMTDKAIKRWHAGDSDAEFTR